MNDKDAIAQALHEAGPRYIVDAQQRPVGYLLTPEEYADYLDMLEDRADSQDTEVQQRLAEAAAPAVEERPTLRAYLQRRPPANATLQD